MLCAALMTSKTSVMGIRTIRDKYCNKYERIGSQKVLDLNQPYIGHVGREKNLILQPDLAENFFYTQKH